MDKLAEYKDLLLTILAEEYAKGHSEGFAAGLVAGAERAQEEPDFESGADIIAIQGEDGSGSVRA